MSDTVTSTECVLLLVSAPASNVTVKVSSLSVFLSAAIEIDDVATPITPEDIATVNVPVFDPPTMSSLLIPVIV